MSRITWKHTSKSSVEASGHLVEKWLLRRAPSWSRAAEVCDSLRDQVRSFRDREQQAHLGNSPSAQPEQLSGASTTALLASLHRSFDAVAHTARRFLNFGCFVGAVVGCFRTLGHVNFKAGLHPFLVPLVSVVRFPRPGLIYGRSACGKGFWKRR